VRCSTRRARWSVSANRRRARGAYESRGDRVLPGPAAELQLLIRAEKLVLEWDVKRDPERVAARQAARVTSCRRPGPNLGRRARSMVQRQSLRSASRLQSKPSRLVWAPAARTCSRAALCERLVSPCGWLTPFVRSDAGGHVRAHVRAPGQAGAHSESSLTKPRPSSRRRFCCFKLSNSARASVTTQAARWQRSL
jgi:hypothetical protein